MQTKYASIASLVICRGSANIVEIPQHNRNLRDTDLLYNFSSTQKISAFEFQMQKIKFPRF